MNVFGASWGDSWGASWGSAPAATPGNCALLPMAIAMQGIGYGKHLAAVQGLWVICSYIEPVVATPMRGGPKRIKDSEISEYERAILDRLRFYETRRVARNNAVALSVAALLCEVLE